jgi:hypothetical protein
MQSASDLDFVIDSPLNLTFLLSKLLICKRITISNCEVAFTRFNLSGLEVNGGTPRLIRCQLHSPDGNGEIFMLSGIDLSHLFAESSRFGDSEEFAFVDLMSTAHFKNCSFQGIKDSAIAILALVMFRFVIVCLQTVGLLLLWSGQKQTIHGQQPRIICLLPSIHERNREKWFRRNLSLTSD